jgi:hypothetical protein
VRTRNAKAHIAHTIHEPQSGPRKESIGAMVLDNYRFTSDPPRFSQQALGMVRVVQDIREQHDIEIVVRKRQMNPVESARRNPRIVSLGYFEPADSKVRALAHDFFSERTIPGSYVEDAGISRNKGCNRRSQRTHPALPDVAIMQPFDRIHRRRMRRMLRKKLDSTV